MTFREKLLKRIESEAVKKFRFGYSCPEISLEETAKVCASFLVDDLCTAIEALDDIAHCTSVSGEGSNGGPCRIKINNDRNARILTARNAIQKLKEKYDAD